MPAYTVAQLKSMLSGYVEPDGDFLSSLNQVIARIMQTGTYRDLTVQYELPIVNNLIALPDDAESILHVMVGGNPANARAQWHDFRTIGFSGNSVTDMGVIDAGYAPVCRLLPTEGVTVLYLLPSNDTANARTYNEDDGEQISIVGFDGTSTHAATFNSVDMSFEFTTAVTSIRSISFNGLLSKYDLCTDSNDQSNTTIATVGPDSGVCRYRLFRVTNYHTESAKAQVLCKRAFKPLVDDDDIVHVGNIGAIKHALLGRIAEDSADIERADYHWQRCTMLLEEEQASVRGSAVPRLNIDPTGTGMLSPLRQLF